MRIIRVLATRLTLESVNKEIKKRGINAELVKDVATTSSAPL